MKLNLFFKYSGLISGIFGALLIILGIIGFFAGTVFSVQRYWSYLWASIPFLMYGIFGLVANIALKYQEKE